MKKPIYCEFNIGHQRVAQLLSCVLLMLSCAVTAGTSGKPNIIIILVDDLGWNDVGYHGSEINTPNIDRLANQGATLNRFYTQPTCSPSRASLLTGMSSVRLGVLGPFSSANDAGLPLDQRLLSEYLQHEGYKTALLGKWHLGFGSDAYTPNARGFEHFYGSLNGGIGHWDHVSAGGLDWQRNGTTLREEGYSTHLLTDEAVRLINNKKARDTFFMLVSYNAPHLPAEAPAEAVQLYSEISHPMRRLHAGMVSEVDNGIGRIINALDQNKLLDNTLVWFLSDNGGLNAGSFSGDLVSLVDKIDTLFGDKAVPIDVVEFVRANVRDGAADNSPLRGGKKNIYEGGVRVPSFIYWPKMIKANRIEQMITVQDIVPTLLDMIAAKDDRTFDGVSHWTRLQGQESNMTNEKPKDYLVSSWDGEALYRYPWKLVLPADGEAELYHLECDPSESNNLVQQEPSIREDLEKAVIKFPRGESANLPMYQTLFSGDGFGGEEVREPWAVQAQTP